MYFDCVLGSAKLGNLPMHTLTHTRTHAHVHARTQGLGLPSAPVPSSREEKINEDFEKVALLESEQDLVEVCECACACGGFEHFRC